MAYLINKDNLTLDQIHELISTGVKLTLDNDTRKKVVDCRNYLEHKITRSTKPIYGVNTGFGSLCNTAIST